MSQDPFHESGLALGPYLRYELCLLEFKIGLLPSKLPNYTSQFRAMFIFQLHNHGRGMKATRSALAFICLMSGVVLYPLGLYLSKVLGHRDTYPSFNPWRLDLFHDLMVPLPVIIPAVLVLIGCVFSVQVFIKTARSGGLRELFRFKTIHLWIGVLVLIYIILAYIVVLS